jgi:hypothetical protein
MSGFSTLELLYPLTKGDVSGHEFHGNQWTKVGKITADRAEFITTNANKFYKAGGTVELVNKNSDAITPYAQKVQKDFADFKKNNPNDTESREYKSLLMMSKALGTDYQSQRMYNAALVAKDASGNLVGVMSLMRDDNKIKIGYLGSTNQPDGIGTALEVEAARTATKFNASVSSEALDTSVSYHEAIGRTIGSGETPSSRWNAKECKAVASLPIGKEYV